jgi:hypothetical protein
MCGRRSRWRFERCDQALGREVRQHLAEIGGKPLRRHGGEDLAQDGMKFAARCRFLKRQPDDGGRGVEMVDGGAGNDKGIAVDHMGLAPGIAAKAGHANVPARKRAASPGSL